MQRRQVQLRHLVRTEQLQPDRVLSWYSVGVLDKPLILGHGAEAREVVLLEVRLTAAESSDESTIGAAGVHGVATPDRELHYASFWTKVDAKTVAVLDGLRNDESLTLVLQLEEEALEWEDVDANSSRRGSKWVAMQIVATQVGVQRQNHANPFIECEPRWLVTPDRNSTLRLVARELAKSKAEILLDQAAHPEKWGEACFDIEWFLALLRGNTHMWVDAPDPELGQVIADKNLWKYHPTAIRIQLDQLSSETRARVLAIADSLWPDQSSGSTSPEQQGLVTYVELLEEPADEYATGKLGSSATLERGLIAAGLHIASKHLRQEQVDAGLIDQTAAGVAISAVVALFAASVAGWLASSNLAFWLVLFGVGALQVASARRRSAQRMAFEERLALVNQACTQVTQYTSATSSRPALDAALAALGKPPRFLAVLASGWGRDRRQA